MVSVSEREVRPVPDRLRASVGGSSLSSTSPSSLLMLPRNCANVCLCGPIALPCLFCVFLRAEKRASPMLTHLAFNRRHRIARTGGETTSNQSSLAEWAGCAATPTPGLGGSGY